MDPAPTHGFGDDVPNLLSIVTAEHAALEATRSGTIFEASSRVSSFLSAISGSLVALAFLGNMAGTEDRTFRLVLLILLPALVVLGLMTYARTLQAGLIDKVCAQRVNRLRMFYVDAVPAVAPYLMPPSRSNDLSIIFGTPSSGGGWWQIFLTTAGTVSVITTILAAVLAGVIGAYATGSLAVALACGAALAVVMMWILYRHQVASWTGAWIPEEQPSGDG